MGSMDTALPGWAVAEVNVPQPETNWVHKASYCLVLFNSFFFPSHLLFTPISPNGPYICAAGFCLRPVLFPGFS